MKPLLIKLSLFILFIIFSLNVAAQHFSIDSLKRVLQTQRKDTAKVITMSILGCREAMAGDLVSASNYAKEALNLAEKINFKKGEAFAYTSAGVIDDFKQAPDSAIQNFFIAVKIHEQLNDKLIIADLLQSIGEDYARKSNSTEALIFLDKALKLYEELKNKEGMAFCYQTIADYYRDINGPEAVANYYKAIKFYEDLGDKKMIAYGFQNIGFVYYYRENYTEALTAFLTALKINRQAADSDGIAEAYIYLSFISRIQKKYAEAINYGSYALKIATAEKNVTSKAGAYFAMGDIFYQQAREFSETNTKQLRLFDQALQNYTGALNNYKYRFDSGGMGDSYGQLSEVSIRLGQFSNAQKYADSALLCAKKVRFNDNLEKSYLVQEELDSVRGDYKRAYNNYKLYIAYRDSIFSEKSTKKLTQTQMQYDFDKKESIAKAEQQKKDAEATRVKNQQLFTILALGIVVLAVVIIAFIQFRNNKQKQKANIVLEETLINLKSAQAQLIQSEKMASLGELTAGIAHEIQNPLNFVNNFSEVNKEMLEELKAERSKPDGERDDNLQNDLINDIKTNEEKINHHGKRADAIVKNMLQHSKQTKGIKELTDINALCDEYLRLSYHGLRAKDKSFNADFKTDFDETIGKINIVPQDIGRALLNLFNNAFYAVNEKKKSSDENYQPTVSVQIKKINDKVEIMIIDNGNGISQNIINKIFQPFFTTKPTGQGTGLGLSLAYDIITKEHNGTIKVESKEGEETSFIIQLPNS